MGNTAQESASQLVEAGATAIGTNCGDLDPAETAKIIAMLRNATDVPLIAQPNAGKPRLVGTKTIFDITTEGFVDGILNCIDAGASIVGGCCGTSPALIQAVAERLKKV